MGDGSTRYASRVLLFDGSGRVLLFLEEFPDLPGQAKWITPGGGAEPGETPHQTAVRELHEETGLLVPDLGPIVHSYGFPVNRPGARHSFAHWDFFVHAVDEPFEPSRERWTAEERLTVKDVGWWSAEELGTAGRGYAPFDLTDLIERFRPE
ncbi:MAG: hypothetical protein BGO95_00865 [Micrococcales bacterium 73-13]|nr:MAG: hypothetical protein BGO95_00865 [Micrococcales bacterium 73-13]